MRKSDAFAYWESKTDDPKLYVYSDYYQYFPATKKQIADRYPWKDLRMYECLEDCLGSTKLFFDIDGKTTDDETLFTAQVAEFLSAVAAVCRKEFSVDPKFLVGRSPPKIKDGCRQFSYRAISESGPRFQTRADIVLFVSKLKSDITSPICDNVDMQVYKGSHVRMMFATKPNEVRIQLPTLLTIDGRSSLMPSDFSSPTPYGLPRLFFKRCFVKSKKPGVSFGVVHPSSEPTPKKVTLTSIATNYSLSPLEQWTWSSSLQTQSAPTDLLVKVIPDESRSHRDALCIVPSMTNQCLVDVSVMHSSPKSCLILTSDGRCLLRCFSPKHHHGRESDETGHERMSSWYKYLIVWHQLADPDKLALPVSWITPTTTIDTPIFPDFDIGNAKDGWRDVLIRSNMKTSKSTSCRRLLQKLWVDYPTLKVVFVVHRRTLAWHLKEKCDATFGPDRVSLYMDIDGAIKESCIVSIDSLHRLDISSRCDVLILDEIESLVPQLFSGTVPLSTRANNARVWNSLLSSARSCIAMDAEFSEASEKMLRTLRPSKPVTFFQNVCQNWNDVRATLVQTDAQLLGMMAADVASGKKVYACFGSRKFMRQRAVPILMEEMDSTKMMVYDSDTENSIKEKHLRNVDETWVNFDVILTTSTNHSGTSFERDHFDAVYGFFGSAFNLSHEDMLQMMGRIRIVHQWNISIPFGAIKEASDIDTIPFDIDTSFSPFQHAELHTLWKSRIKQRQTPTRLVSRLHQMGIQLTMAPFMPPDALIDVRKHLSELATSIREEDSELLRSVPYLEDEDWTKLLLDTRLGICGRDQKYVLLANDIYRYFGIRSFDGYDEKVLIGSSAKQVFAHRAIIEIYCHNGVIQWDNLLAKIKEEELHRQRLLPDTLYLKSLHPEWLVLSNVVSSVSSSKLWLISDFKSFITDTLLPLYRRLESELRMQMFIHPKLFCDTNGKAMRRSIEGSFVSRKLPLFLLSKILKKIGWKVSKNKTHVSIKEVKYPTIPNRSLRFWVKHIGNL